MIGAILTQNTNWKNVERAFENIRSGGYQIADLKRLNKSQTETMIRPSGYFRQKTKKLQNVFSLLNQTPVADFLAMPPLKARKIFLAVNGIGPETADSILLYAFQKPIFVVDAYTRRIFSRLGHIQPIAPYDQIQALFMSHLPRRHQLYNEYHALIVKLAKENCKKVPFCETCCLQASCQHFKTAIDHSLRQ